MEQHVVHAHDERGGDLILAGRGQDDLLRAALEVAGGLLGGIVSAGGLDDVLRAAAGPGDHRRVGLAEDLNSVTVDDQVLVLVLHRAVELTEHGIVFDHIDHVIQIRFAQVDTADVELLRMLDHDAQHDAADAAEAVDAHFDSHNDNPPQKM